MKKSTIIEVISVLYIILFLYTGLSKLMEYSVFKEQIATSPLLAPVAKIIAISLPWIEFLIAILLVVPKWRLKGLYASFILMTLFSLYIIGILSFNKELPCSCGGVIAQLSWTQHILFNSALIILAGFGISLEKKLRKMERDELLSVARNNWVV